MSHCKSNFSPIHKEWVGSKANADRNHILWLNLIITILIRISKPARFTFHSLVTHFLSSRSISGRRTVSASMAALLPLAEPFIWTSSWFICFTQSSITGLKLSDENIAVSPGHSHFSHIPFSSGLCKLTVEKMLGTGVVGDLLCSMSSEHSESLLNVECLSVSPQAFLQYNFFDKTGQD